MKREYYIAKSDLWYKICREWEEDWVKKQEWWQGNSYTWNKEFAKTYYHMSEATSALVIARIRWEKTPITLTKKSGLEEKKEKSSWSEL